VLIPPGHPNELRDILMRFRRGELIVKLETKRLHKDGHVIDVWVTVSPVKSKAGKVVALPWLPATSPHKDRSRGPCA
jgi:hypothetical protein